ncbi:MAG TPA: hypothetical protein VME63_02035 [Dyella sp.]|uniref:hypothetical protein n=1 Tax=Dyella sp. TaxID=1869338 RepID=UPI002D12634F|nr:hypothetical protein [Dyella sp.]HTV84152.1 hypothetical protein [Dyella sp.]
MNEDVFNVTLLEGALGSVLVLLAHGGVAAAEHALLGVLGEKGEYAFWAMGGVGRFEENLPGVAVCYR